MRRKEINMRYAFKSTLVAALVVICVGAVTTAAAFATPTKGEIVNKNLEAPIKGKFAGGGKKTISLEVAEGAVIYCSSAVASGAFTSKTVGEETLTLDNCYAEPGKCKTTGAKVQGEVVIPLKLSVTNKTKNGTAGEIDYLLSELAEIEFECGVTVKVKMKGSFLTLVPREKLRTVYDFETAGSKGRQNYEVATDPLQISLAGQEFTDVSLTQLTEDTFEEEVKFI
jgi:hypothetical protein